MISFTSRRISGQVGTYQGAVSWRLFPGNLHGNAMFSGLYGNHLISLINDWLHDFWLR